MVKLEVEICGRFIVDKHTHYQVGCSVGHREATIIISGDVAHEFVSKYNCPITSAEKFKVQIDFCRNDERVQECQDVYKPGSHLMGAVRSIEDITYVPSGSKIKI